MTMVQGSIDIAAQFGTVGGAARTHELKRTHLRPPSRH